MSGHMEEAGSNPPAPGMHVSTVFMRLGIPSYFGPLPMHTVLKT